MEREVVVLGRGVTPPGAQQADDRVEQREVRKRPREQQEPDRKRERDERALSELSALATSLGLGS